MSYLGLKFYYGLLGYFTGEKGQATAILADGTEKTVETFSVSFTFLALTVLAWALLSYLLGSIDFAVLISKKKYGDDVRNYGSGNAGTTNMLRVYGKKAAILALLGDLFKGIAAGLGGMILAGQGCGYIAGLCCILGHCFPIWYGFKGGKGVATSLGVIVSLEPLVGLLCLLVFVGVVAFSKYVSLGSIMAAIVYPMLLQGAFNVLYADLRAAEAPGASPFALPQLISIVIMVVIVARHWQNIKRLYRGEENKISFKKKPETCEN